MAPGTCIITTKKLIGSRRSQQLFEVRDVELRQYSVSWTNSSIKLYVHNITNGSPISEECSSSSARDDSAVTDVFDEPANSMDVNDEVEQQMNEESGAEYFENVGSPDTPEWSIAARLPIAAIDLFLAAKEAEERESQKSEKQPKKKQRWLFESSSDEDVQDMEVITTARPVDHIEVPSCSNPPSPHTSPTQEDDEVIEILSRSNDPVSDLIESPSHTPLIDDSVVIKYMAENSIRRTKKNFMNCPFKKYLKNIGNFNRLALRVEVFASNTRKTPRLVGRPSKSSSRPASILSQIAFKTVHSRIRAKPKQDKISTRIRAVINKTHDANDLENRLIQAILDMNILDRNMDSVQKLQKKFPGMSTSYIKNCILAVKRYKQLL